MTSSSTCERTRWRCFWDCSFTVEAALIRAGIEFHATKCTYTSPAYVTTIPTQPAGGLSGPVVVSLRLVQKGLAAWTVEIQARYPGSHSGPVHIGDPAEIGIIDIGKPECRPTSVPRGLHTNVLGLRRHLRGRAGPIGRRIRHYSHTPTTCSSSTTMQTRSNTEESQIGELIS